MLYMSDCNKDHWLYRRITVHFNEYQPKAEYNVFIKVCVAFQASDSMSLGNTFLWPSFVSKAYVEDP